MIEPPSQHLVQTLSEYGLCKPADLRRCRPLVRRLARDLPAFDSIWIDALVRTRKLTYFQARELESGRRNRLSVGPCILLNRLGHSEQSQTFLARRRGGRQRSVLKLIDTTIEERTARLAALEELADRFRGSAHPSFVAPHACLVHDGRLVTISRYVPGLHLGELLVRRGRFRVANVAAIAQQVVDALAVLEAQGQVHGDIHLGNVRLTSAGVAVLVDTGVSLAVRPELTIHARRPPERYEGIAPELIGTGNHPTVSSDLYALGCLLWQLLAGRPPFPTGDPLGKLAAHQTKSIGDVRLWAPDTPAALAEAITSFTARHPDDRPASLREVRERLGAPGRASRRRLSRFRAAFETAAPRSRTTAEPGAASRWPLALILFLAAGLGAGLLDREARRDPLGVPRRVTAYLQQASTEWFDAQQATTSPSHDELADAADTTSGHVLPAADAGGVILLDSSEPYLWRPLESPRQVVIRGQAGLRPTILVDDKPCRAAVEQLTLENVHFVRQPSSERSDKLPALLMVQARRLSVVGCSFETHRLAAADEETPAEVVRPVAVAWKRQGGEQSSGGQLALRDTLFLGHTTAVYLSDAPSEVQCANCAKVGAGAMFTLSSDVPAGRVLALQLQQLTLRRCESLLRWRETATAGVTGYVAIEAGDCVFDLAGPAASLLQFVGDAPLHADTTRVEVTGADSLARPGLAVATQTLSTGEVRGLGNVAVVELEGITTGPFTFAGPVSRLPSDAAVDTFDMPRRSPQPPGIDAARLAGIAPRGLTQSAN